MRIEPVGDRFGKGGKRGVAHSVQSAGIRTQFRIETAPILNLAIALGAVFIGVQGVEWARLISEGLTLSSSTFGAFFYLIVGTHALHAIPALVVLGWAAMGLRKGTLTADAFAAVRLFWYFVVLVWPVLYVLVYL